MSRLETRVPPVIWWAWAALVVLLVDNSFGDDVLDGWGRLVAVVLAVAGFGIAVSALAGFFTAKTTVDPHGIDKASSLVTDGIYRFTRNPMYLGLLLILIGWGFWRGTLAGVLIGAIAFVAVMTRLQIVPEERMLAGKFGTEYEAFTQQTRRWL